MTDQDTDNTDWIASWIAQQRELLARGASGSNAQPEAADLQSQWRQAGAAWFESLKNATSSGTERPRLDPFKVGELLLDAWTSTTHYQSAVAEQAAQALGGLPPIGLAREHTEAWRELASAHAECKRMEHELKAVLVKVQLDALELLERRVREQGAGQIDGFRALYDLWVECGEQVYGQLAHSESYSRLQAELGNASMRLRSRTQRLIEQLLKQLDLPTRSEINSLHRQVRDLRREVDAMTEVKQRRAVRKTASRVKSPTPKRRSKTKARAR